VCIASQRGVKLGENGMSIFQNIKTRHKGHGCKIRVMNYSGDDVLTTYALDKPETVTVAQSDLAAFMDSCIAEYGGQVNPNVFGRRIGMNEFDMVDIKAPDFDLSLFSEVLVQPVPLTGG